MSGKKRTEAWDRTVKAADQLKPVASQVKPLAKGTQEAARRQFFRTRAWAAPQVERTSKAIEHTVAPKVSSMLATAAERIDPAKPRRGRWRLPVGIAAATAAAASAAAAVIRKRTKGEADVAEDDLGNHTSGGSSESGTADTHPDTVVSEQIRAS